ncbi:SH3 domain-containing protein [Pedobacter sp. ok626]|uniref:DUF4236 domain-containing protein n=1 Tax=Pedobacter sp. ok626 TaxID=1761882 RepID=UPI000883A6B8|nr:DUF4236 domain-containing protein [Pedobacter sp. ok626]SDK40171.1 SH3 domain-containing protein [Pedobacter sp. ok626]
MGLLYRKSLKLGLLRINFSRGGISYSAGVRGARINTGPKGTYVTIGTNGIYYRQKIGGVVQSPASPIIVQNPGIHTITSAPIDQLTDVDSKDFVNELNEKTAKISLVNWFGIFPLIAFVFILSQYSLSSSEIIKQEGGSRNIAIIDSHVGSYIRSLPNGNSKILGVAKDDEEFILLDATNKKWLKIHFNDTVGYVAKKLARLSVVDISKQSSSEIYINNPYYLWILGGGVCFFVVLIHFLLKLDRKRCEMELHYEMDDQMAVIYNRFVTHFSDFISTKRKWQYLHGQQNNDWKRTGGAGRLINRVAISQVYANNAPSKYLKTNVNIPHIKLRNTELFFLPERLLVKRGGKFAAIFYKNLHIESSTTRFIEDESVPGDARVVDHTWRYVNRNGGPDRRFNNNRKLPICLYSQYTFTSGTGIYEIISTSRIGAFDGFSNYLAKIGILQSKMNIGNQIN